MSAGADLILYNARVITLNPARPQAEAVAVSGSKIRAVGSRQDILNLRKPHTRLIDCRGLTLLPGLIDAHCHLLATASALAGVDCGPAAVGSIADLQMALARRAGELPAGQWVRGFGLEPSGLLEGRFPTRWELDAAVPGRPARLEHGSGHATVLNSRGLQLAGIDALTPDPPEGVIQRDEATGEPDGLLLELSGFLRARLGATRTTEEFTDGVARLSQRLLSYGITSVNDAGPNNGLAHWQTFASLREGGAFAPRITLMAGAGNLGQFADAGLGWGAGDDRLSLGHAKVMLTRTTGALHPGPADLRELVVGALLSGFPVAIHAIEEEAVAAAADCLTEAGPAAAIVPAGGDFDGGKFPVPRNRIEHCAECPPELVERVRRAGATVVTQPGFIHWRGDGYLERVEGRLLPYLYPLSALACAGIPLAFSSDAPVIEPSPWPAIYGAVTRRTAGGKVLPGDGFDGKGRGMTVLEAVQAYTTGGAWAEGKEDRKGAVRPGLLADLALVDTDLTGEEPERVRDTRVRLTVIGGRVVWDDGIAGMGGTEG